MKPRPRSASRAARPAVAAPGERLQKLLAAAGFGSRRQCEEMILAGRIDVDGKVITELGARADPDKQRVRVDGEPLRLPRLVYYAVNKPVGYVSTHSDPAGRPRVIDLIPASRERLFTVGRLDLSSEGLMLLTNDGELANRLAHPRYGIHKTYQAVVAGEPARETLDALRRGVRLAEGLARVVSVRVLKQQAHSAQLEIVLAEGKNREIRRILAKVGHKVMTLRRIALGSLRLKELAPGEVRRLTFEEIDRLRELAYAKKPRGGGRPRAAGKSPKKPAGKRPAGDAPAGRASRPDSPSGRTIIGDTPATDRGGVRGSQRPSRPTKGTKAGGKPSARKSPVGKPPRKQR